MKVTRIWKDLLKSQLNDFSFDPINLACSEKLATGYELGHICGKYYPYDGIPTKINLVNDLRNLMGVYRELKGYMNNRSVEEVIDTFIQKHDDFDYNFIDNEFKPDAYNLSINTPPLIAEERVKYERDFKGVKVDFNNNESKKLGYTGEKLVLEYERRYLKDNSRSDLADLVEHISITKGDGVGYDILSYDLEGKKKFIEVKATKCGKGTPFIATINEIEFSKKYSDNYFLYRVYDLDINRKSGELYILRGSIEDNFKIIPTQYKVFR